MSLRSSVVMAGLALFAAFPPVPGSAQTPSDVPFKKPSGWEPQPRRGFNVVLLLGDMQDTGGQDTVPNAARKALADMKDFLPYKGYRLLDTQWVLGSTSGPTITRLRGVDDQEYGLELRAQQTMVPAGGFAPGTTFVRFVLTDASDGAGTGAGDGGRTQPKELKSDTTTLEIGREIFQLERERDDLQPRISKGRKDVDVGMASVDEVKRLEVQLAAVTRRISDLKQSLSAASSKASGRAVIDTSFRMEDGETVVVGTSKVKGGGRALIALLTATSDRAKNSSK
jgi:hypothetical protein